MVGTRDAVAGSMTFCAVVLNPENSTFIAFLGYFFRLRGCSNPNFSKTKAEFLEQNQLVQVIIFEINF